MPSSRSRNQHAQTEVRRGSGAQSDCLWVLLPQGEGCDCGLLVEGQQRTPLALFTLTGNLEEQVQQSQTGPDYHLMPLGGVRPRVLFSPDFSFV